MLSLRYRKLTQHTHTKCLLELIITFQFFFKHAQQTFICKRVDTQPLPHIAEVYNTVEMAQHVLHAR
jgi:hypothetical protein